MNHEVKFTVTDRGFKHYTPVKDVKVYESSAADRPMIWLNNELGGDSAHLTWQEALALAETLISAVRNHYQLQGEK